MTRFVAADIGVIGIGRVAAAFAVVVLAASTGCAPSSKPSPAPSSSANRAAAHQSALKDGRTLDQLAQAERTRHPAPHTANKAAATPPGVEPGALALRSKDDPRAFLSLDDALTNVAAPASQPAAQGDHTITRAEVTPEQELAALHAYVKGRNAAADNRHLQAVTEYLKAYAVDPTAPQLLREMARSYDALGNPTKALELLEQLVQVEPGDSEAMFAIGIAAGTRRDFAKAARYLGEFRNSGKSFSHDPAADILADFTLAMALRELGYDRASIDVGERAASFDLPRQPSAQLNTGRLASVYRQRGDTWRAIGDAYCRLGEYDHALAAYAAAASLPTADPSALHPRVIFAQLSLGQPYNAQQTLLHALTASAGSGPSDDQAPGVNDRDVRLCAYLAENAQPVDHLARAVVKLHRLHPQEGGLVRAAALLLPADQAVLALREFIDQRPGDMQAVAQLMEWVARDDLDAAAALTIGLAADHPDRANAYASRLVQAAPNMTQTMQAIERQPASPARALVQSLLAFRAGSVGRSWTICQAGLEQWPDDRWLRLRAVELAAAMREPALANAAIAACADLNDAPALITLSQARRALNQTAEALQLAQQAIDADPGNVDAMVEVARAHHARALSLAAEGASAADVRAEVDQAMTVANRAIELAPQRDDGYQVLEGICGPGGVLADQDLFIDLVRRLTQANPKSPLLARLVAEQARDRGQFDAALERAISAYDGNPADGESLGLAVDVWIRAGKLDEAERWLREQLAQRPGDAALREQLVAVQVRQNQSDRAIEELESIVDADADDWVARRMLETVYRATGQADAALELGELRLRERPVGVRRDLELAALYAGAERAEPALNALVSVRDHAADASLDDLTSAIGIAGRVRGDAERTQALTVALVDITIDRFPEAPLQVYGSAMRAMALQHPKALDDRFDNMVNEAIARSKGAGDATLESARLWHDLCQALVGDGAPAAAARAMRLRLKSGQEFEATLLAALVRMTVALDAAAAYEAEHEQQDVEAARATARETIAMLSDMQNRVSLQRVFDMPEPIDLATAVYEASVLYNIVGCEAGSELLLRESLAALPEQAMAMNNLGYMLIERNDDASREPDVIAMVERAHAMEPSEHNILDTIGWLRYKQGRFADETGADGSNVPGARTLIQKAIDTAPEPGVEVFDHLGDVCWRMGDRDAAIEAWSRVVRLLDDGTIRQNLVQNLAVMQTRNWQMIVMDGERLYDREYAPVLERARGKLEAVKAGNEPEVAPVWPMQQRSVIDGRAPATTEPQK